MKFVKYFFLLLPVCLITAPSFGQMIQDPTTWKYEVKKKSATEYQFIFHLEIKDKWHIWSINPGSDSMLIPTSFAFNDNKKIKLKGKVTEKGKITTTTMDGVDGKVSYLSDKVDYVQEVTIAGPCKVTGKLTYQTCNDKMCLPPKDKDFAFEIK